MSEEIKEPVETTECKCESCAKVKEFLFYAGAVFTGVFLAILLSAALLKPKCPPAPGMYPPPPAGIQQQLPPAGIQQQLPPPPMMRDMKGGRLDGNPPVEFRGGHHPNGPERFDRGGRPDKAGRPDRAARPMPQDAPKPVK